MSAAEIQETEYDQSKAIVEADQASIQASKFRNLVKKVSGRELSTMEAAKFLELFQGELDKALLDATNSFIAKHFGKK